MKMGGHSTRESFESINNHGKRCFDQAVLHQEAVASTKLDGETISIDGPVTVGKPELKPLRTKLIWVGVDLDGTLAAPLWTPDNPTSEIGDPIWENVQKVRLLYTKGYKIIIHTSRAWTDYQIIEQWLLHYDIPFKEIQCGKPLYAAYIDDRAIAADDPDWTPRNDG
jgi:hypothetical protein